MKKRTRYFVLLLLIVVLGAVKLSSFVEVDPEGIFALKNAFPQNNSHKPRVDRLVESIQEQHYYTAVSGLQWLRTDPNLTLDQITALQDAIGKIQSRLAAQADNGDKTAARHLHALQNETDYKNKPE